MPNYYTTAFISENQQETPEGYLLCRNVPIARTGQLIYSAQELTDENGQPIIDAPAGKVVVSRAPEVLFDAVTIASFEGKPVTLLHPTEMITPENWKLYAAGVIQNVRPGESPDDDKLMADLLITDAEAIFAIRNGLREVSLGYDAQYVADGPGQGHQTSIIGNHCALVPAGRCGSECAIQDQISLKEIGMTKLKGLKEQLRSWFSAFDAAVDEAEPPAQPTNDADPPAGDPPAAGDPPDPAVPAQDAADISVIVNDMRLQLDACREEMGRYSDRIAVLEEAINRLTAEPAPPATPTGDSVPDAETMSRAEILAPGIATSADIIPSALKAAYATTDGKAIIDTLSCGKAPAFDSIELFVAASELLKEQRKARLAETKAPTNDAPAPVSQHKRLNDRAKEMFPVPKL